VSTLVLCVDRSNDVGKKAGVETPVAGWEAVQSLVTAVGLADPEDASVNCLLESLRIAQELQDDGSEAVVAVVSGRSDTVVGADRAIAQQVDDLVERYAPDSAVVVVDSAEDERVVPIVESRVAVDGVDRVVVRQARDIESTYYLLKQFLGDEELRSTVMVPLGIALIVLPALALQFSPQVALAGFATLLGAVLLLKGLAVGKRVASTPDRVRDTLYSGQVSVVTYVVAIGLSLVGGFLGVLAVSEAAADAATLVQVAQFTFAAVPWLALAALTASAGRLVDEFISEEGVRSPILNLPSAVLAVGLVVRGFSGYFLERQAVIPSIDVTIGEAIRLTPTPGQRLAVFIVAGIVVSLVGVRLAASITDETLDDVLEQ
jgi:putative membrane protein